MLDISWSAVYAIYAVHYLARNPGRHVTVQEIAARGDIPEAFLANLFPVLRRHDLVRALRGKGYMLNRLAAQISVYDIVTAVDGERAFPGACAMKSLMCGHMDQCDMSTAWQNIRRYVADVLGSVTMDRLPGTMGIPACALERGSGKGKEKGPQA